MRGSSADEGVLGAALLQWLDLLAMQGVFTTDRDHVIRSWNRWLATNTGYDAGDVIGRSVFDALPDLESRGFREYFDAALRGQTTMLAHGLHRYVIPVAGVDGRSIRQSGSIGPLTVGDDIVGAVCVIEDVTERLRNERELRAQIAASDRARALAEEAVRARDEFLTTLSHEIRTPLNAVLGWTRILLARPPGAEMLARALEVFDRNALAQVRLIDDLLDTARIISGKLRLDAQPVDLSRAILAAIDVVQPTAAAKKVTIQYESGTEPRTMRGDPDRLQQIVWNLLANAVKFTPPGGRVTVSVAQSASELTLTVADNGEGIAPEFLPLVFERFRQADPSATRRHSGLGIGLSLVRQLVELHGGRIAVASDIGVGSVFTVTFPARPEFGEDFASVVEASSELAGLRVLVVDDAAEGREMLTIALEQHGARVTAVASASEALALLDGTPRLELPHAIVADVQGAGDAALALGPALGRRTAASGGAIPCVGVTAYDSPQVKRRVLAAGFHAHVVKPLSPATMAAVVRSLVRSD